MARFLIVLGLAILVVGLLWPYLSKLGLGRLPGDIVIERENGTVYVPLATCLLLSLLLSLVLWEPAAHGSNDLGLAPDDPALGARCRQIGDGQRAAVRPDDILGPRSKGLCHQ